VARLSGKDEGNSPGEKSLGKNLLRALKSKRFSIKKSKKKKKGLLRFMFLSTFTESHGKKERES